MSKEAMKLALEALIRSRKAVSGDLDLARCAYGSNDPDGHRYDDAKQALVTLDKAITALREALAEQPAQQEPVAVHQFRKRGCSDWYDGHPDHTDGGGPYEARTLYTSPPAQRKPLTDEELDAMFSKTLKGKKLVNWVARAIEAAHNIKEKP